MPVEAIGVARPQRSDVANTATIPQAQVSQPIASVVQPPPGSLMNAPPAVDPLHEPTTGGVKVAGPQQALERHHFDRLMRSLGLSEAVRDGVISEQEAREIGIALSALRSAAADQGDAQVLDTYEEALKIARIQSIPADELLDPVHAGDFLVVAPASLHETLMPLLVHRRALGHEVALVDPEAVAERFAGSRHEALAAFVEAAHRSWPEGQPRYLLLVGDTHHIPGHSGARNPFLLGDRVLSDQPYGDFQADGTPEVAVGRLPVDADADLGAMVHKIVEYEALTLPGLWQTRAALVDGDPAWGEAVGYGAAWAAALESGGLPRDYDTSRFSFNPQASIGYDDDSRVSAWLNQGSLLLAYVGHGSQTRINGLNVRDIASIQPAAGNPIVVMSACLSGSYDYHRGSLAEELVEGDGPAIATVAASSISGQLNPAWSKILGQEIMEEDHATLGDAFVAAQRRLSANRVGGLPWLLGVGSNAADLGLLFYSWATDEDLGSFDRSHLHMYNLFGDPATRVRQPGKLEGLRTSGRLEAGNRVQIDVELPQGITQGVMTVTLNKPLDETLEPLESVREAGLSDDELRARRERNAARYNQRAAATMVAAIANGKVAGDIVLPAGTPAGSYDLRVTVVGDRDVAIGHRSVRVRSGARRGRSASAR